jgi:uncharacterized protein YdhG (YjbR/CyaY superfamily)
LAALYAGVRGQAQIPSLLTLNAGVTKIGYVSSDEIDQYLADLEEPKRSTLQRLRQTILEVVPEAEEGISYQVPAFRVDGKVIAGFAAFKNHLSYLPHSGSIFPLLPDEVASYKTSRGRSSSQSTHRYRSHWSSDSSGCESPKRSLRDLTDKTAWCETAVWWAPPSRQRTGAC